ncbi:MAG: hypothetical protein ACRD29_19940 [Acidimicrobiales bacterium]
MGAPVKATAVSYEEFGVNFVTGVVTADRIREAIASVSRETITVGPLRAGPAEAAVVEAVGTVGAAEVERADVDRTVGFAARVPIHLCLDVRIGGRRSRFGGEVTVKLHITVRTLLPLTLAFDVDRVRRRDVLVSLQASSTVSRLLGTLGRIDEQVRRQVVDWVNEMVDSDEARELREIDVLSLVDRAWRPDSRHEPPH